MARAPAPRPASTGRSLALANRITAPIAIVRAAPRPAPRVSAPARRVALANRVAAPIAVAHQNAKPVRYMPANAARVSHGLALANRVAAPIEIAREQAVRHQAALQLMQAAHAHESGGGLSLGAIVNPIAGIAGSALHGVEGALAGGLGKAASFGSSMLQGGEAAGLAALHDVLHNAAWNQNIGGQALPGHASAVHALAEGVAKGDPVASLLVHGDPLEAARVALHNPLNTGLDLLGGAGLAGRAAGTLSDVAHAGQAGGVLAARGQRLARGARELAPGVTEARQFSPNLMVAAAQKASDQGQLGAFGRLLQGKSGAKLLAQRATEHHMVTQALESRVGAAAEKIGRSNGLKGEQLKTAVAQAQHSATAEMHARAIAENSIGGRPYTSLRAARAGRTRLANSLGVDPQSMTVTASVMKKGAGAHHWLSHVVPEGQQFEQGHEFRLLPTPFADRMSAHYTPQGEMMRVPLPGGHEINAANFTRQFRNTVLPFSTKWVTGNVLEGVLRNSLAHVLPTDPILARRAIQAMEKNGHHFEADVLRGHALGGLNYGMQERLSKEVADATGHTTKVGKAAELYNKNVPERIFTANRKVEQGIAQATLGRFMRSHMHNVGQTATPENIAREFAKPEVARAAGRYIRKTLGKYDAFTPGTERFVRNLAPFGPWYANSAKFVGKTMPIDHPLLTSGLTAAHNATWKGWQKTHASNNPNQEKFLGMPTGSLNYAVKTGKASYEDLARYTPFGAAMDSPLNVALQAVLPQAQGPVRNVLGQDPFGQDLMAPGAASKRTPTGRLSKASKHRVASESGPAWLTALSALIGQEAGPANALHRVLVDKGATPYNTEKIWDLNPKMKPGSQRGPRNALSGVNRVFNPFFPVVTRPKPKTSSHARSSGSPNGFGGGSSGGGSSGGGFGGGGASGKSSSGFSSYHLGDGHRALAVLPDRVVSKERGQGKGGHMVAGGARAPLQWSNTGVPYETTPGGDHITYGHAIDRIWGALEHLPNHLSFSEPFSQLTIRPLLSETDHTTDPIRTIQRNSAHNWTKNPRRGQWKGRELGNASPDRTLRRI